jgi:hypothetical protein
MWVSRTIEEYFCAKKSCGDAEICALEAAGIVLMKNPFDNVANREDGGTMRPLSRSKRQLRLGWD